jgi:2-dehydro-3-deoxy-D-arabinonate dehydratase
MQLAKWVLPDGRVGVGAVQSGQAHPFDLGNAGFASFGEFLAADDLEAVADKLLSTSAESQPFDELTPLAPIDAHEVWAAGVTYQRSQQARREESEGAGSFYDLVYAADRPELFFKATPHRVVGPGGAVRVRRDSSWSVPEPELALVLSPTGRLVGFTVGNDMSARDIEGANPLYLPQAKVYDACCALGPVITLVGQMPTRDETTVTMQIRRGGDVAFDGSTSLSNMRRTYDDLIRWLLRDNSFPTGAVLMTGTGIVPPDEFSLQGGDEISISITGIGTLQNVVAD